MKPLSIICGFFIIALFTSSHAAAQSRSDNMVALSWEVSFPTNNDFLKETSWAGGRIEFRHFLKPNFSIGLGLSWNAFDEYIPTKTYKNIGGNTAVTTDMVRQIYTVPMTALAHYYFTVSNKNIKPYAGLGLGAQYAEQNAFFNVYEVGDNNWGFVVRPEIGSLFRIGSNAHILFAGSYNISTNKNDAFDISSLKQFALNLGIAWGF